MRTSCIDWVTTLKRCHGGPHLTRYPLQRTTDAGRAPQTRRTCHRGWLGAGTRRRTPGVLRAIVSKWTRRYRADGMAGLADRSSKPHRSPAQTAQRTERRIIATYSSQGRSDQKAVEQRRSLFNGSVHLLLLSQQGGPYQCRQQAVSCPART
ncbi:leucine zipper domain-containing protein [Cryobacterium psychrophilum]|uniref:DNA-binding domain-containing protein n=1 Tax=Cryobacterium psychrophilum TaxID=41988 RepID=A0A4Y8KQV9_9MICO|nr:hypothetical protein E3T53_01230 [Cryobacterium psychrophilum]